MQGWIHSDHYAGYGDDIYVPWYGDFHRHFAHELILCFVDVVYLAFRMLQLWEYRRSARLILFATLPIFLLGETVSCILSSIALYGESRSLFL